QLAADVDDPRLSLPEVAALVALGARAAAAATLAGVIEDHARAAKATPPVGALAAFALAPTASLGPTLVAWFERGDPRARAAVCAALAGIPQAHAATVARGLRDADASVRASCIEVAVVRERDQPSASTLARIRELARDRDHRVRARAIAALVALAPNALPKLEAGDPPEVRAAFAGAHPRNADDTLRELAGDRDETVRAAALESLAGRAPDLLVTAVSDPAAPVRLAAIGGLSDEAVLEALTHDVSPEVALAASVRLGARRGRAALTHLTLARLVEAPPEGAARVHAILAWLLAP
ncbi:MAG: hypothetical protein NT062_01655, partial [Proteobacteria bacterium]|nr:hypothetical protein [Pseudomonadota bacterium]